MNEQISPQELQEMIQQVAEAETENFAELAQLAGLDIKQDFAEADLSGTYLVDMDLSGGNFEETDFTGVNLSNADLRRAFLIKADLSNANLVGANLKGANLANANLNQANLNHADCKGANLTSTDLRDTNLSNADLRGAYFAPMMSRSINVHRQKHSVTTKVQIRRIADNLSGANVTNTRFGHNSGISKSLKHDLECRGAIFEDSPNKPIYASQRR